MTHPAYVPNGTFFIEPVKSGVLDNLTFAAKELIALKGHVTGCGNPKWLEDHPPAAAHSPCITTLLNAGARFVGRSISDEMAFSLDGENVHYGTPINPAVFGGIPGGSSSGSASLVASGNVKFALGTDTAGSVRIPAAYCGIYGFRPTHGAISLEGVHPMASSFDVIGWFSKKSKIMRLVGEQLLPQGQGQDQRFSGKLLVFKQLFEQLAAPIAKRYEKALAQLASNGFELVEVDLSWLDFDLILEVLRNIQWWELNQAHGQWIAENIGCFGEEIRGRLLNIVSVTRQDYEEHQAIRATLIRDFAERVDPNDILVFPTAPEVAPKLGRDIATARAFRAKLMRHNCIATVAGFPQLSIPMKGQNDAPLGLSLMSGKQRDQVLLSLAERIKI